MWPRKQLDIGWRDLAFGLAQTLLPRKAPSDVEVIGADWIPPHEAIISLSVRTGWDLLLSALQLPAGSEVILSAVTIPDMARIIEHHGLVPVPVDVDAERLEPSLEEIERAITPSTRAILVAHLFGPRAEMAPIIEIARRHDLFVIEDCAQAFVGREYAGHADSDCSLFSFGPIKTSTALGGAVLRVSDPNVRTHMLAMQHDYPVQARRAYVTRVLKYALFRLLSTPHVYGALVRIYGWLGIDYDRAFGNATHSFGTTDFFTQIRRRPSAPLLRMLRRRLAHFATNGLQQLNRRTSRGNQLAQILPPGTVVGDQNSSHTYWVMPIRVANTSEVIIALRAAGFDATCRSSLIIVAAPEASYEQPACARWLADIIFIPNGHAIGDSEWRRLADLLGEVAIAPLPTPRSLTAAAPLTV